MIQISFQFQKHETIRRCWILCTLLSYFFQHSSYKISSNSKHKTGVKELHITWKYFTGYKCLHCSRAYTRKDTLQRHMKTKCGSFKQFQCRLCPYRSGFLHHFKGHLASKHTLVVDSKTVYDFVNKTEENTSEPVYLQDFNFLYTQL